MTKDVLVQVKGIQSRYDMPEDQAEVLENFTRGMYYQKNGKQYLFYEEYLEGEEQPVKNSVRVEPEMLTITKKGAVESSMVFVPGEKTNSLYQSPVGALELSCNTDLLTIEEQLDLVKIVLEYTLEMNQSYVSDNRVEITVRPASELEE